MLFRFFDKLAGFDSGEIRRFFLDSPDASARYAEQLNERNVRNAVVFLYFVIFSQLVVAYGRIIGDLGFPYYPAFLIVLSVVLIFFSRFAFFKKNIEKISLLLFSAWALTFPFFIISPRPWRERPGGSAGGRRRSSPGCPCSSAQ